MSKIKDDLIDKLEKGLDIDWSTEPKSTCSNCKRKLFTTVSINAGMCRSCRGDRIGKESQGPMSGWVYDQQDYKIRN